MSTWREVRNFASQKFHLTRVSTVRGNFRLHAMCACTRDDRI